jgi:hypothetical protein
MLYVSEYVIYVHHTYGYHPHKSVVNPYIKMANRSFENVAQFKYLGMIVTNQNLIQEEIKRRLNLGTFCYYSVQKLLFSRLLSKNVHYIHSFSFATVFLAQLTLILML